MMYEIAGEKWEYMVWPMQNKTRPRTESWEIPTFEKRMEERISQGNARKQQADITTEWWNACNARMEAS